ncbi:hypothetical protein L227DRAFT_624580 [Lentinus tigrinus ALCF2SS1-6]|uniref:Uncharacterized protein n=1 Tax=Lentinus tigrinus ALCF2SS1-6 TaxID=1328759 RepID=A0A5C2SAJ5_9APHY|nr:hypothetical protein L227DRAFT_624580 [Lentinus tigrinus ALCF2SS1-6]
MPCGTCGRENRGSHRPSSLRREEDRVDVWEVTAAGKDGEAYIHMTPKYIVRIYAPSTRFRRSTRATCPTLSNNAFDTSQSPPSRVPTPRDLCTNVDVRRPLNGLSRSSHRDRSAIRWQSVRFARQRSIVNSIKWPRYRAMGACEYRKKGWWPDKLGGERKRCCGGAPTIGSHIHSRSTIDWMWRLGVIG